MAGIKDKDWLKRSFMVSSRAINAQDMFRREATEASFKFTDTTLGGNFAINPPPQFTSSADIKVPSRFTESAGMGRYYSEALDDRGELIHMRFGVPQYNSLTNFFTNFYNTTSASLANKGRAPNLFYSIGKVIGFVISIPAIPIIWANNVINFLSKTQSSKYYYLKPAMPLYWNAVSTMVNAIGVNMGVIGRVMSDGENEIRKNDPTQLEETVNINKTMSGADLSIYSEVYRKDGGIDIYAMATRAQRMAARNRKRMQEAVDNSNGWDDVQQRIIDANTELVTNDKPAIEFSKYIESYHKTLTSNYNSSTEGNIDAELVGENFDSIGSGTGFGEYLEAELSDGSQFVTFRTDYVGSVNESFTNSVGESSLASSLNSTTSSGRSARFSLADGNFGDGLLGGTLTGIVNAAKSVVSGTLDELNIQGIAAFSGTAFADIPNVWESSSATLPKSSYTIELRSPYGVPLARFQNLIVPLCMILGGGLPLSTGKQSYTSPFLVELYSKGKSQVRLGIIDSISVTRGVGNLGWTRNGEPLGIDVTFTVLDLSTVLHMPIISNFTSIGSVVNTMASGLGETALDVVNYLASSNFDDSNAYTDYMAVLGGLSLADQIYPMNLLRLRKSQRLANWNQHTTAAHQANWLVGTSLGQIASGLTTATLDARER